MPQFHEEISTTSANTFLHEAGTLIEIYPNDFIKLKNRELTRSQLEEKLIENFKHIFPNKEFNDIDWATTKEIASCKSNQQNFLDTRQTFHQKFRINLITNQLPLNAKLFKQKITQTKKCVDCDQDETILHLFQCKTTIDQKAKLISSSYELMRTRLPKNIQKMKLNLKSILLQPHEILNDFETPPYLLGYYCHSTQDKFRQKNPQLETKTIKILHKCFIDCWLSTFYNLIWIPRTEISRKEISKEKIQTKTKWST